MPLREPYLLVVEDDPEIRGFTAELLRAEGYAVREAADGLHALEQLTSHAERPFLILLDLMMPRMNGWELIERLRGDDALALIPICTMSAVEGPKEVAHVLNKPFEIDELMTVVARFSG